MYTVRILFAEEYHPTSEEYERMITDYSKRQGVYDLIPQRVHSTNLSTSGYTVKITPEKLRSVKIDKKFVLAKRIAETELECLREQIKEYEENPDGRWADLITVQTDVDTQLVSVPHFLLGVNCILAM